MHTDIVRENVQDMLAVEEELHQMLRHAKDDDALGRHASARTLMQRIEDTTDGNLAALRSLVDQLGGQSTIKRALGAAMGAASGVWQRVRQNDSASRIMRDAYGALSFAVVCYEMLHTTALAVRENATATLAIGNLKRYTPLIIELTHLIPEVVVDELSAEGKVPNDPDAAREAVRNAREAWNEAQTST